MHLMAAFPAYCTGSGRRHDFGGAECISGSSNVGSCTSTTSVSFGQLEIDENDNSLTWGLIHHNELAHMLNMGLGKTMVIDSRSFLEYNTSTIQQSVNVCCSKLVKRRLQQDKVHVLDLLNQTCNIGADASWDVIVYDQCTEDPSQLTSDNFVAVLLNKLSTTFNSVAFLKGGFLTFQASHPSLTENKSSSHRCSTLTSLSQPCMPVSNVGPTRILPFLYLGSQQDSLNQDLAQVNGITYILNVSKTCPRPPFILEGHFHRIPVNDNYCEKLLPFFQEAFQFLDKVREANGCVLVHCLGGVSRSATLAIAYIMRYFRMSSDEAYRYVKDKRPTISPNFNFLGQLLEYEKILRQEELEEVAWRKALREEEGISVDSDRAFPGVMDLHSSSPSSPGPRTAQRPFLADFAPHLFLLPVIPSMTSFSQRFAASRQSVQQATVATSATEDMLDLHNNSNDVVDLLNFAHPSSELCPFPGPVSESCPFPGLVSESCPFPGPKSAMCPFPGPKSEVCPFPEPSQKNLGSESAFCSTVHRSHETVQATTHASSDVCKTKQDISSYCDNRWQDFKPATVQSPVCPFTGFPSPANVTEDFPQSTCTRTGFPRPGHYGSNNPTVTWETGLPPTDSSELSHPTATKLTETENVFKNSVTYHDIAKSNNLSSDLNPEPVASSLQPNMSERADDILIQSSQKQQVRSKTGFSLSSMLSSFRWKSRPPTLSLGSPVGTVKDINRHKKKHAVENCGGADGRIQLTPVSEAMENCDLVTSDCVSEGVKENVAVRDSCTESVKSNEFDVVQHVSQSGSSLSNATIIAMASTHNNLYSPSSTTKSPHTHIMSTTSTSTHIMSTTSTSETSCVPFNLIQPRRLNISAKKFTLPLSSPTSDFSSLVASSACMLPSPSDSNKRKSFPPASSDSPDKLAKTENSHPHILSPPKTLNLAQSLVGKMRPRLTPRRPFVLPISSPTAATTEDMARLQVTSPSDPHLEAAKHDGFRARDQISCYSSCSDLNIEKISDFMMDTKESQPNMTFMSSDAHYVSSLNAGMSYGYTKWKSTMSLGKLVTTNDNVGERVTLNKVDTPQLQHTNTSMFGSPSSSLTSTKSAISLSSSSSLSKSCTSIYSPSAASLSVSNRNSISSSCSVNVQGFSQFPTTSLDKLSFTPCYTKDIVQELNQQETEQAVSLDQGTSPSDANLVSSALDSPMSISSGSSAPSIASSTLSPVESIMEHVLSEGTAFNSGTMNYSSTAFSFVQSQALLSNRGLSTDRGCQQNSPNSVQISSSDFIQSPSTMPQATVAPTIPVHYTPYYSSSQLLEPLSPMSLSDSTSSSPLRSPTRTCITSPLTSSVSTPASSLSSPVIASPPFSPLVSSPVSSSSHMAGTVASIASSLNTKVVLRRDKNKRVMDRPNSIAFSSYPACDLVPGTSDSQTPQGQASQDDSSEAYMLGKSKRSRRCNNPDFHIPPGRTSWGGYSEREMYRQITAAMENAMLRTQVFSSAQDRRLTPGQISSRKARSLDDIVDGNVDEDDFMSSQPGMSPWSRCTDQSMFEKYRCSLQNVSEPYHSSSSLSSSGSHSGSMEIQVS